MRHLEDKANGHLMFKEYGTPSKKYDKFYIVWLAKLSGIVVCYHIQQYMKENEVRKLGVRCPLTWPLVMDNNKMGYDNTFSSAAMCFKYPQAIKIQTIVISRKMLKHRI